MRIICCKFGNKFTDLHVDNLKHMIDKYSAQNMIVLKLLQIIRTTMFLINFKCIVSLKTKSIL